MACAVAVCVLISLSLLNSRRAKAPDLNNFGHQWEQYDSTLFYRLQSVDDLLSYADSILGPGARQTQAFNDFLADLISKRFYHGYSYYSIRDNWMAWIAGTFLWDHLHAIVLPNDILMHPMAACSQQAIVLKECFLKTGVDYREVDLNEHFVLEAMAGGEWLFYDADLEPKIVSKRTSLQNLIQTGELYTAYKDRLSPQRIETVFAQPVYREVNAPIAANGTLFQKTTKFLSFSLPIILFLTLLIYPELKNEAG